MRRGNYQFKNPPSHWTRRPRIKGIGRKRTIPAEKRAMLYMLMKKRHELLKEINAMVDSCYPDGTTSYGRNRTAMLRRIFVEKGR